MWVLFGWANGQIAPDAVAAHHQDALHDEGPVYQLRIYEIFEPNKAAFHARFRDHALPIMRKYGFNIRSMWESRLNGRTEFVYLLEWPSESVMKDRWAKFMADEEWARIKQETARQHGTLVGQIQDRTLKTLEYSPVLR